MEANDSEVHIGVVRLQQPEVVVSDAGAGKSASGISGVVTSRVLVAQEASLKRKRWTPRSQSCHRSQPLLWAVFKDSRSTRGRAPEKVRGAFQKKGGLVCARRLVERAQDVADWHARCSREGQSLIAFPSSCCVLPSVPEYVGHSTSQGLYLRLLQTHVEVPFCREFPTVKRCGPGEDSTEVQQAIPLTSQQWRRLETVALVNDGTTRKVLSVWLLVLLRMRFVHIQFSVARLEDHWVTNGKKRQQGIRRSLHWTALDLGLAGSIQVLSRASELPGKECIPSGEPC